MECVPFPHNLFHAPRARARRRTAVVLLLSDTCGLMRSLLVYQIKKATSLERIELEVSPGNKLLHGFPPA